MHKKKLHIVFSSLAMSTVVLSPAVGASENPFQLRETGQHPMLAEASPAPQAQGDRPMKCPEGRCAGKMKEMMDTNKDGKVSREEFMKHHEQMFDMMDKNKDGVLDDTEMAHMPEMKGMGGMGGMRHGPGGPRGMEGMKQGAEPSPKP